MIRAVTALVFLLAAGCAAEETCTQRRVDRCFADVGCASDETCALAVSEMNALCECLTALGCDQEWYHAYCDAAPYSPDGGCPMCEE